jgi:hypothetical protein
VSIYEVLVLAALAGAGGFAYYLYRSDTRTKPPGSEVRQVATNDLMFKRVPKDRDSNG